MIKISRQDYKAVHGEGYGYLQGQTPAIPALEMAAEDYRRLARLAAHGTVPVLSMATDVHYYDSDTNAYNTIADIPGTDPRAGYVMVGAHLDSWAAGDGAMDGRRRCCGSRWKQPGSSLNSVSTPRGQFGFALFAGVEEQWGLVRGLTSHDISRDVRLMRVVI